MLRNTTQLATTLALAAGAILYASDHDNLERHWRLALVMARSAALTIWPAPREQPANPAPARR